MNYLNELSPPFISDENESFFNSLKKKLNLFNECIGRSDFKNILSAEDSCSIESISRKILESIEEYLNGKSGNAYRIIEEQLCMHYKGSWDNITYDLNNKNSLIRIRKSTFNLNKRKDLFHIPFNLRQKVAKQRYSIEGLPCLYLAATSYTTWLELDKPNFNEMWVSAFRPTNEIKILDLSYTLEKLMNDYKNGLLIRKSIIDKLKLFPFVLATSFRVKYPNEFFHEEYIVSGKLLQWIVNNTFFEGIRYLSTKLGSYKDFDSLWCASNFVIPPKDHKPDEIFNKFLTQSFIITKPQNCAVLVSYSNAGEVTAYQTGGGKFGEFTEVPTITESALNENIDALIFKNYINTDFFNIDGYLSCSFELDYIESQTPPNSVADHSESQNPLVNL